MIKVHPVRNPGALVYHSTTTACSDGVLTTLPCDSEVYDDESYHSTSTNNSRLTAPRPGLYLATMAGYFGVSGSGYRRGFIAKNGTNIAGSGDGGAVSASNVAFVAVTTVVRLIAGDYLEAKALVGGDNLDWTFDTDRSFSIGYLGP